MAEKQERTYSYNEYLKTFFPLGSQNQRDDRRQKSFGDELVETSITSLKKSLEPKAIRSSGELTSGAILPFECDRFR